MATPTRTPVIGRATRTGAKERQVEPAPTPVPVGDDDEDLEEYNILASVVPPKLRRTATQAAERVATLGTHLLGSNASILVRATQAFFGFCVWYTVFHGFFGVSWCFGQAGHYVAPDADPPQHEQLPTVFEQAAKGQE